MNTNELKDKTYLGDAVYCGHDGFQFWIWTEHGSGPDQRPIALEPITLMMLERYIKSIKEKYSQDKSAN